MLNCVCVCVCVCVLNRYMTEKYRNGHPLLSHKPQSYIFAPSFIILHISQTTNLTVIFTAVKEHVSANENCA